MCHKPQCLDCFDDELVGEWAEEWHLPWTENKPAKRCIAAGKEIREDTLERRCM